MGKGKGAWNTKAQKDLDFWQSQIVADFDNGKPISLNTPRPRYSPLYDYIGLIEALKKAPKQKDSLDEIVKELGLRVLQPGDFYQI